ncbi:ABC transporter substrate-binding protein [bacterium]|nr:ABC transporter substrate-binding protein [candidate division CSSED10-310 bacterium]
MRSFLVAVLITCLLSPALFGGIPHAPRKQRIISDYAIAIEILMALGQRHTLLGGHSGIAHKEFFSKVVPEFLALPVVGSRGVFNLESVMALKPDLIISRERGGQEQAKQLREMGIDVLSIDAETPEAMNEAIRQIADLTGAGDRAARLLEYMSVRRRTVEETLAGVPAELRPRVYVTGALGFLSIPSARMHQYSLVERAGGRPCGEDTVGGWNQVSAEQLLAWNPDYILISRDTRNIDLADVLADERWKDLRAVKNARVALFPSNLQAWDRPGPQGILGLLWLARTMHPELFPELDVKAEAEYFYRNFYDVGFAASGGELAGPVP